MKVLKFGGTSVGTPGNMKQVANIVGQEDDCIVVLSALSGTTNKLLEFTDLLKVGESAEAESLLEELRDHYAAFVNELFEPSSLIDEVNTIIDQKFNYLQSTTKKLINPKLERSILAQGELMSTNIFHHFLLSKQQDNRLLSALDFMRLNAESEPDFDYIGGELKKMMNGKGLRVTQGFICRDEFGEVDNLKRGGSDYTASIIGKVLQADEIQIWTDIDGMHNNDPRHVEGTRAVSHLSFDEAAELAYFGAKILHPSSVRPAQESNVPVRLKNTMHPDSPGTIISGDVSGGGIKAIAAKDDIVAIKIKSGRMLLAYGFLKKIFEVFEWYQTPIDMITTSEVAVSLTIDDTTNLEGIKTDLEKLGTVELDHKQSIICIVGDNLQEGTGTASAIFNALEDIDIRMISFGGSKNNISVLVNSAQKTRALQNLNDALFHD